jgi:hypothetical protein
MPGGWGFWSPQYSCSPPRDPVAERSTREREIARAVAASEAWTGVAPSAQVVRCIEHFVDHVLAAGRRLIIRWLAPDTESANLIRHYKGVAFAKRKAVVIPPIHNEDTLATAWHEVAHLLARSVSGRLAREEAAWRYAREHAPIWSTWMQTAMVVSVRSYLADATPEAIIEVQNCERLISDHQYRLERQRRVNLEVERERHDFIYGKKS